MINMASPLRGKRFEIYEIQLEKAIFISVIKFVKQAHDCTVSATKMWKNRQIIRCIEAFGYVLGLERKKCLIIQT